MIPLEIGEVRHTFAPALHNIAAGIILGFLPLGLGTYFSYAMVRMLPDTLKRVHVIDRIEDWAIVATLGIIAIVCFGAGLLWMRFTYQLGGTRAHVGSDGFAVCRPDNTDVFLWCDIASVVEVHLFEKVPIFKPPLLWIMPEVMSRRFEIIRRDGFELAFSANDFRRHEFLAMCIKAELVELGTPWTIVKRKGNF